MVPNLKILLQTMALPRAFYILGAGASAKLVPFTQQLRTEIRSAYAALGMYPASPAPKTELFKRVVGGWRYTDTHDYRENALQHITAGALEFLVQRLLSYPLRGAVPTQYRLLQQVGAPSVFFNFNLDGVAAASLGSRHLVLEPHGSVDREWTEARNFDDLLELALDFEFPHIHPKCLPGPEASMITGTPSYSRARRWLRAAPAAVLLGYSFGKHAGGFDDAESFEYVVEHLRATNCHILVVGPDPFELVALIEERIRARRVLPVPLYWDTFATAAITALGSRRHVGNGLSDDAIRAIETAYFDSLELAA